MAGLPLISHTSGDAVVAYRGGVPVRANHLLAEVMRLAAVLPAGGHVLNVCADRYRFTVGFLASLVADKVSLLPSTHTPEVIRQLNVFAPDAFCLTDDANCDIDLPQFRFPESAIGADPPWQRLEIDPARLAAYVFTSGSTGTPLPYRKTWGLLAACVREEAKRLGLLDGRAHAIVGTVPPQHMYGFESTVLVALQSGNAFCAERPFFPADIRSVLAGVPRPRILVSTPIHLRMLIAADVDLPAVDLVVSATAPLFQNLACEVEERFGTQLLEIYGSTETGQIATRRTAQSAEWQLWSGVQLTTRDDRTWAQGGHIEQPTPMWDVLEVTAADRFLLHGRMADLINIAGKRSSLAYLNYQLNAIPGVIDGAFFVRDEQQASITGITRVAAVAVAPGLDADALVALLRTRIDPVFLPRPLLLVDKLPRNDTGKLPQQSLQSLVNGAMQRVAPK